MSLHDQPDHLPKLRWARASDRLHVTLFAGMWRVMIRANDVALEPSRRRGGRPIVARWFTSRVEAYSYARRSVALWRRQHPQEHRAFAASQRAAQKRAGGQR